MSDNKINETPVAAPMILVDATKLASQMNDIFVIEKDGRDYHTDTTPGGNTIILHDEQDIETVSRFINCMQCDNLQIVSNHDFMGEYDFRIFEASTGEFIVDCVTAEQPCVKWFVTLGDAITYIDTAYEGLSNGDLLDEFFSDTVIGVNNLSVFDNREDDEDDDADEDEDGEDEEEDEEDEDE